MKKPKPTDIHIRLTAEDRRALDRARGLVPVAAWCREAIRRAFGEGKK